MIMGSEDQVEII